MFGYARTVTDDGWLEYAEVTPRMLHTLQRIGPGGVIIADPDRCDYYATHARTLDHANFVPLIVYGYHDLVNDLIEYAEYGVRVWQVLADAVDCTAYECLEKRLQSMADTGFVVTRTRQHMQKLGFDLTSAPDYYPRCAKPGALARPSTAMVRDRYSDWINPSITVTVTSPLREQVGDLSLIKISDDGRHVTGWPKALRNQFIAAANTRRVREAVDAHLRNL